MGNNIFDCLCCSGNNTQEIKEESLQLSKWHSGKGKVVKWRQRRDHEARQTVARGLMPFRDHPQGGSHYLTPPLPMRVFSTVFPFVTRFQVLGRMPVP